MILIVNENEDPKHIVYTDASGTAARLYLPGKSEIKISATDYDRIRSNKTAAAVIDGWISTKEIRVFVTAGDLAV